MQTIARAVCISKQPLAILVCASLHTLHVFDLSTLTRPLLCCRYQADHVYALNTVYFLCAVIGVFVISNCLVRFAPEWLRRTKGWRATTSLSRYMAYRGYHLLVVRSWSPSLGVIILGLIGAVFFLGESINNILFAVSPLKNE